MHLAALLSAEERQVRHNAIWSIHHACNGNAPNCTRFLGCNGAWAQVQALLKDDDEDVQNLADALSTMLNPEDPAEDDDGRNNVSSQNSTNGSETEPSAQTPRS